jgi:hypothetical protein
MDPVYIIQASNPERIRLYAISQGQVNPLIIDAKQTEWWNLLPRSEEREIYLEDSSNQENVIKFLHSYGLTKIFSFPSQPQPLTSEERKTFFETQNQRLPIHLRS